MLLGCKLVDIITLLLNLPFIEKVKIIWSLKLNTNRRVREPLTRILLHRERE